MYLSKGTTGMAAVFDLVIRNGTILDGSGEAAVDGDVAISGGKIAAVGKVSGSGREEIEAKGKLVTPGFVDIHTHYDGQATWSDRFSPSSNHGVTSVVMGNCGVGFAPCRPDHREMLLQVMEGVEEIPKPVLAEGVTWTWESFPEYLDSLSRMRYDLDCATLVPHAAVRVYVMGKRGADREPATQQDAIRMSALVKEGLEAGALGFSTSRTMIHRLTDGTLAPTITAGEEELTAIALGMKETGKGIIQLTGDDYDVAQDGVTGLAMWRRIVESSGRPLSMALFQKSRLYKEKWRLSLKFLEEAHRDGLPIRAQVSNRAVGVLMGLDCERNAFTGCPSFEKIQHLPLDQKVAEMRKPDMRARLLSEEPYDANPGKLVQLRGFEQMFLLGDPPNYTPAKDSHIAALAAQRGVPVLELAYDLMLENDGRTIFYFPANNYFDFNFDAVEAMMRHPLTFQGTGDGGAHVGTICDASLTTHMLTYWTRDRRDGEKVPLPWAVQELTSKTADFFGLKDRGYLKPGYKADVNVIDYDRLHLHAPRAVHDLPAGGKRLFQKADGYVATICGGEITYREGVATGALPGRLVRGAQAAPV